MHQKVVKAGFELSYQFLISFSKLGMRAKMIQSLLSLIVVVLVL